MCRASLQEPPCVLRPAMLRSMCSPYSLMGSGRVEEHISQARNANRADQCSTAQQQSSSAARARQQFRGQQRRGSKNFPIWD